MAFLNPWMKYGFFLAKSILLKQYEYGNKKKIYITCPRVSQMQEKVQKALAKIDFLFGLVLDSYDFLEGLER